MDAPHLARRLWEVVEPLHAVVYFAPEPTEAAKALGLKGWWMGYFAGRVAPMGAVSAPVATAAFFGFHPDMVARALPDAWALADPSAVLESRVAAAAATLRRVLGPTVDEVATELEADLRQAVDSSDVGGRALSAAWAAVPATGDPVADLWLTLTALREHRGDGHVIACVAHDFGPLDATLTMVASGRVPRDRIQPHRGWSDADWSSAQASLERRGLLADGHLTDAGARARTAIEDATDRLAARPVDALGPARTETIIDRLAPVARQVFDDGVVPIPNPIGAARPR